MSGTDERPPDEDLPALLLAVARGDRPGGVVRIPTSYDVAVAGSAAEGAGWAFAHLEGREIPSMGQLHDALAVALDLPGHYGRNLDALHDCLTELDRPTLLLWDDWWVLAQAHPRRFEKLTAVLDERPDLLVVLLCGDGAPGS